MTTDRDSILLLASKLKHAGMQLAHAYAHTSKISGGVLKRRRLHRRRELEDNFSEALDDLRALATAMPESGEALLLAAEEIENGEPWITAVGASRIIRKHIASLPANPAADDLAAEYQRIHAEGEAHGRNMAALERAHQLDADDMRAVARVQRSADGPHGVLYAMILPGVEPPRIHEGMALFAHPAPAAPALVVDAAMFHRACEAFKKARNSGELREGDWIQAALTAALSTTQQGEQP